MTEKLNIGEMEYPEVQKYRLGILNKMRDPKATASLRAVLSEHFMDVVAQTSCYDINTLWSERSELFIILDGFVAEEDDTPPDNEQPPEVVALYKKWYRFVDQEVGKRMKLLGETPKIMGRIQGTLDEWQKGE